MAEGYEERSRNEFRAKVERLIAAGDPDWERKLYGEQRLTQAAWHWDQIDRLVREHKAAHPEIEKIEIRGHEWPPEPVQGPTVETADDDCRDR
jgi:hypothetical protein